MIPERWQRVEEVLQAALDLPETERPALVAQACSGDHELQMEALSLIAAYEEAGDFMEQPALEQDAHVLLGHDEQNCIALEIGPYKVIQRLGAGGMGEVYLAQDRRLGRLVALKVLPPYFVSDDVRLRRFQIEARAASALNHPNILTIYEMGQSDNLHFIATEYIAGETIRKLVQAQSLTLGQVVDIAMQLLSGLSAAHAAGIIHRDIKPENIMRRDDGVIKILDFGIAKLIEAPTSELTTLTQSAANSHTQTGTLLGTTAYISPEQVRGLQVDERTDIWSTGVVLYEMLTSQRPFAGLTNADTIVAILERTPAPLYAGKVRAQALRLLQQIVDRVLSKQADERYKSAAEMLDDLTAVKRELDLGPNKKRFEIGAETSVDEAQAVVARYASGRRGRPLVVPAIIASVFVLVAAVLLNQLYRSRRPSVTPPPVKIYAQMSEAERLSFVSEQEQRISAMIGDRPVKLNDEALKTVKAHVDHHANLATAPPGVDSLTVVHERAAPYVPVIAKAFAERRIPIVVGIYLAMLESAYRPCFKGGVGDRGLFQFLPQTARRYGVTPGEMCDVNKMAPAAAHYVADRMAELGDDSQSMTLVLLSYNRGDPAVRDTLRMLRETDPNYERNFWTLFANRDKLDETFRKESVHYIPAFFAVAIIGENPEAFQIPLPPLSSFANAR